VSERFGDDADGAVYETLTMSVDVFTSYSAGDVGAFRTILGPGRL
jgi:hypothetical protein